MTNDDFLNEIIKFKLPVNRGSQTAHDYLRDYYDNYLNILEKALTKNKNREMRFEFYDLIYSNLGEIQNISDRLIDVFDNYDQADMPNLYSMFDDLINDMYNYGQLYTRIISYNHKGILPRLYRIRGGSSDYSREDIFHIPFSKRELIQPYRYSIAGYPCIYLATSIELCWFECGMPKQFSVCEYEFSPTKKQEELSLIDFTIQPLDLIAIFKAWIAKNPDNLDEIERHFLTYILSFPLRVACSLSVENRSCSYIEEYLIPQLLLLWIRRNKGFFDGISYATASNISVAKEWGNDFNIAIPAKDISSDYCNELKEMFKISLPVKCSLSNIFKKRELEINKIKSFTNELQNTYMYGFPLEPYREILSLCRSFIMFYDVIIRENYSEAELLHQLTDTLSLFSYLYRIDDQYIEDRAIKSGKDLSLTEDEIKMSLKSILSRFNTEVKPVIIDFYKYANMIACDVNIDPKTFEHIK